ncbi:MAG: CapA family protein [Candidatus Pacebacteria bacterium]|nr:CapA family protein [Candidatus Paceibacterota bacterium]
MPKLNALIITIILLAIAGIAGKVVYDEFSNPQYRRVVIENNFNSEDAVSDTQQVIADTDTEIRKIETETKSRKILFVGDLMLDREVENLIKKNSVLYPFQKINKFTEKYDFVFGNLEGPIVENPPSFSQKSLTFAFSKNVIEGLAFGNFDVVSLANNHTLNMKEKGLAETRKFLAEGNIKAVGDPLKCSENFLYQKNDLVFLAFNKTYAKSCADEEIVKTIKLISSASPENFIIVNIHWGDEYQLTSSPAQQKLARKIIDAGADLIIGHHPHVVQEIGIYKNKLVFYSLGNFIFDQYFSKNTQEGLAVEVEIYPSQKVPRDIFSSKKETVQRKLIFRLFPLESKLSQPILMSSEDAERFLEKLAERSDQNLFDKIKSGIIK